jgi:asparagine synthase (glutamine-hydrolysing)
MCGINGIYAYHYAANPISRDELERTRDHMAARGPDGKGLWVEDDERIGFGHRRLSIIDLSDAGAQPMASPDGRLVLTFNGEIYNYLELRQSLETAGHLFRSRSDTEVLLHLYAEKGEAMVHDLRGMFAFAIWDAEQRRLLLARDPYGIKPLYYADDGWTFRFASQVKALVAGGSLSREPEPAGIVGFYLFGSVPEPHTIFADVRVLPAGATMIVDRIGARTPHRYHSIAAVYHDAENRLDGAAGQREALQVALRDSVASHLVADVPVGAFLSAGIDSGALVGLMRDAGASKIETVTIAFGEFRGRAEDEAPLAADVATLYGTDHQTRIVTRAEFEADLPNIIVAMDQPSIDGINTWFVAKAARERGLKVAISGLGGDELLGGYPAFRDIPRWVGLLRMPGALPLLGATARRLTRPLIDALGVNPKAAGMLELGGSWAGAYLLKRALFMPWELSRVLGRDMVDAGLARLRPLRLIQQVITPEPASAFARVASMEASLYMRNQLLRDTDWASMAHGLEVRVPLVDSVLLRQAAAAGVMSQAPSKAILAGAPAVPLPQSIVGRRKTGFTTPVGDWMRAATRADAMAPTVSRLSRRAWARGWSCFIGQQASVPA